MRVSREEGNGQRSSVIRRWKKMDSRISCSNEVLHCEFEMTNGEIFALKEGQVSENDVALYG